MKYLLMYIWKLLYWISGIILVVGLLIFAMNISKMVTDSLVLQPILAIAMWIGVSFLVLKPLRILDHFLEQKVSLDKGARLNFFMFVTFVLISIAIFCGAIYTFILWLDLMNDTVNRSLDDYWTLIFPLVLFSASVASLLGSFKLYKKYEKLSKI